MAVLVLDLILTLNIVIIFTLIVTLIIPLTLVTTLLLISTLILVLSSSLFFSMERIYCLTSKTSSVSSYSPCSSITYLQDLRFDVVVHFQQLQTQSTKLDTSFHLRLPPVSHQASGQASTTLQITTGLDRPHTRLSLCLPHC